MNSLRCLLLAGLSLLTACASTTDRTQGARVEPVQRGASEDVAALYARIDSITSVFHAGVEAMAAGERERGELALSGALDDLRAATDQCLAVAGCESARFLEAWERLLRLQSLHLAEQAGEIREMTAAGEDELIDAEAGSGMLLTDLPEASRSMTLLKGRDLRDFIEINAPVKAALDEWLTHLRPNLIEAWENYQYLRHEMWPAYEEAGLPEALLFAIMAKESGGKVHAVSHAGASGPLQFMYHTGMRYGLGRRDGFDTRFDPASAARANVAYLNDQLRIFNNDLELVLGAYNGGENRMKRLYERSRRKAFWDDQIYYQLPRETRDYVPMVVAAAWLFMHPKDYGLEFPRIEGTPAEIRLAKPISLAELTICLGQSGSRNGWFRTLRNLNPRLNPQEKAKAGSVVRVPAVLVPVYEQQCVQGYWAELAADLHGAKFPAGPQVGSYVVRRGDTLAAISRRYRCANTQQLASLNNLAAPKYLIREGQKLKVPVCS